MDPARHEYPRPQFEREEWINLNGEWSFTFDFGKSGHERGYPESTGFRDSINVPFAPESRLSGVGHTDFIEAEWYQRSFSLPERWAGKRIMLNFGGSDYHTEVFVNGQLAGWHYGGAVSFAIDITRFSEVGSENNLVVLIRDEVRSGSQPGGKQSPEFRFETHKCHYTRTTGIWQTVWLEAIHPAGLERVRIVSDVENEALLMSPSYFGAASRGSDRDKELRIRVRDESGIEVASVSEASFSGMAHRMEISSPTLWEPGNPHLYDVELEVVSNGNVLDRVSSYAGMRHVSTSDNRVYLNGKPLYQRLVLDQGFYPDGIWTAPDDDSLRRDIELSMAAGFNGARLHQKVFEERFHFWADKLGYLTWAESPSWGLTVTDPVSHRNFLPEWHEIIRRDWNHPSIITWTALNETGLIDVDPAQHRRFHHDLYELTRTLDPTRPAHDSSGYIHVKSDIWSVHDYTQEPAEFERAISTDAEGMPFRNFPAWEPPYEGQPYLVDEFGGIKWIPSPDEAYVETSWGYGNEPRSEEEFYQRLEGLVKAIDDRSDICGWCYTQLTDVEQEQNGIYFADRRPKFDMKRVKRIFSGRESKPVVGPESR